MSAFLTAEAASYRIGRAALVDGATLSLAPGTVTVVIGPNGAGKSTLLRLLAGEIAPTSGRIAVEGTAVAAIPAWRLACLRAVLPQASRLTFPFLVEEVVRIGIEGLGRRLGRSARAGILDEALRRADVAHLAGRLYGSLSGGEQQRVQFARILAQLAAGRTMESRQALLLDEPIASLDLKHQLGLLEAARRLAEDGVAVLAILHDLNLAAVFADTVVAMWRGRVVAQGAPAAVIDDRLLREVFEVDLEVGRLPDRSRTFLLPRRAAAPTA